MNLRVVPELSPVQAGASNGPTRVPSFHILTKPIGPICNLNCTYCFYLEKERLYPDQARWRMPDDVLEAYIRQYIDGQNVPEISFAWQGGEPTLLGVDFFRKAVALQRKYAGGKKIHNALQTNGTLLDDEWCQFLSEEDFLVGLSVDGPREMNDRYRVDKQGRDTFDDVMRGLSFLRKHATAFNTLTVVSRSNGDHPLEVYRFLKSIGSVVHQYIPLVERPADADAKRQNLDLAAPPILDGRTESPAVTDWSVRPLQYGQFLSAIFDEWVRNDVGETFVQLFDVMLGIWCGLPSSLCVFSEKCGVALAVEHNGDLYSCDHYVYPQYKLGNVLSQTLADMVASPQQRKFGGDKADTLPQYCRQCEVRFACNGECPKHRFMTTPDGQAGLNYLCAGYKHFFNHIDPLMRTMARLLQDEQPPARIMEILRLQTR
ncbi:anaerobic sulfatase maturase [Humisphaera borealis]|uniref:Anaerobic sulfatase maturase n=1 Tax=Humisphaera borealis TaxID=2807512 RepID=A0A7M2WT73_9BACT|nr:anaerobic sulfatase maturase [Humisphaera borealis]QOV88708.1 anaerobic sulfatase maturase [Humisphaera borealis]